MGKFKLYSFFSCAFIFSIATHAATTIYIDDNNMNNYLTVGKNALIGKNNDYQFKLSNKVALPNGVIKKKYNLYYKDIPVFNSVLTSSEINDNEMAWYGQMMIDIEGDIVNMAPAIDEKTVLNITKGKIQLKENDLIKNEKIQLYVRINDNNKAELIYLVSFNVEGYKVQRPYYIVDVHTGDLISSWDGLTTRDAEGPGGNQKVGSYYYGRDFGFLNVSDNCQMTNADVDTYDMQNQRNGGTLYRFACPVNSSDRPVNNARPVNGAYSPLNDAHYFASMVLSMYRNWFSINPLKSKFKVRVHFGTNYEGAFWDGQQMTFGDGGNNLYPLTALDVMGHEVSHGVTEFNSGLVYRGQSGGINEAFSDMAGEAAENYMNRQIGKENDWLGGAAIMKNQAAMRYFINPTLDGASIDNAKDYNDSMDVHHTSGVFNKAFYTLSTTPNWDIRKAFSAFLLANQVYWQPEATFNSAACGVARAAADLGYEVNDVLASFKGVGVNANCNVTDPESDDEVEISNGTIINNIKINAGDAHRYLLEVPVLNRYPYSYDMLSIHVYNSENNAKNNVQLYVRYENGSLKKIDQVKKLAGNEFFNIKKPAAGNYHILIKGVAPDTVNLNAFYGNFQ
ncbi:MULTISPECIES: M4 family metallopeptidase [Legionella]|uniref:Neutral metalloproteinase n=1 Tax=Legionella resiliens TaxID=2905958 RepID=A0ABS8WZF0_9GAMM|nr:MULTISPECIES: M4 family metallopeptidase [unclassified Legionella]MCE0721958.1 M4 family metallopeptidase [Legionella sp. 9fVS26]MCE3531112.1 M4 family metallopeptidase [Legionella sp. 8cVS16]QLZ70700.1 Neutral protease [Legionella sp. PC1000]